MILGTTQSFLARRKAKLIVPDRPLEATLFVFGVNSNAL